MRTVQRLADVERKMAELTDALYENEPDWQGIDEERLQRLIEALLKIYAAKIQSADFGATNGKPISPLPREATLTHTEAALFVDKLLDRMDIDLFEVQMFRSLCNSFGS